MSLINKFSVTCGVNPTVDYPINLPHTDVAGIQAILDTIPPAQGTFVYEFNSDPSQNTYGVKGANCVSGCKSSLTVDGKTVNMISCCNGDEYVINISDLISSDAGNSIILGSDNKLYATAGGADTDDQNASEVPFTAIPASATTIALDSTNVQALGAEIGQEIKALQDVPQIFAKVGGVQTTNNVGHTEAETATRTGAVVIGANTAPTTALTKLDVIGDIDVDNTTASTGMITKNGVNFLHNFGVSNTFLGINAGNRTLTGTNNTAIGFNNLAALNNGTGNTVLGFRNLFNSISTQYCIAIGYESLFRTISSNSNIAIGNQVLYNNLTGQRNIGLGSGSNFYNLSGFENIGIGYDSYQNNVLGNQNVGIGRFAGLYVQESNNTAIGNAAYSGFNLLSTTAIIALSTTQITLGTAMSPAPTVGSYVTIFQTTGVSTISGFYYGSWKVISPTVLEAIPPTVLGTTGTVTTASIRGSLGFTNSFAIGYNSNPQGSNEGQLGNSSLVAVRTPATMYALGFVPISDKRAKTEIELVGVKNLITGEQVNLYKWKYIATGRADVGYIAQEIREIPSLAGFVETSKDIDWEASVAKVNEKLKTDYKFWSDFDDKEVMEVAEKEMANLYYEQSFGSYAEYAQWKLERETQRQSELTAYDELVARITESNRVLLENDIINKQIVAEDINRKEFDIAYLEAEIRAEGSNPSRTRRLTALQRELLELQTALNSIPYQEVVPEYNGMQELFDISGATLEEFNTYTVYADDIMKLNGQAIDRLLA